MCPDGSFDTLFVHGLGRAKSYAIANDTLTITLTDEGTMTFVVGVAAGSTPAATAAATAKPTAAPTAKPTAKPTAAPTSKPTTKPTAAPGATPAPSPVTGLIGKVWQLTAITEKVPAFQGVVPAAQQPNYTIEFKTGGTFSAKADCNNVAGTFTTADPMTASGDLALVLGPTTLVACADGSYSDLYMLALGNTASYAIASNQLTITLKDEGTLVYK
jgi:heat shock protein HslJ